MGTLLDRVTPAAITAFFLTKTPSVRIVPAPTKTLSLTLFDRIEVIESQTGHDTTYSIVSEKHHIDKGGTRHRVSWLLEPAETGVFFVIGSHSIGDSQILSPR